MKQLTRISRRPVTFDQAQAEAKKNLMRLTSIHDIASTGEYFKDRFFIDSLALYTRRGIDKAVIEREGGLTIDNVKLSPDIFERVPQGQPILIFLRDVMETEVQGIRHISTKASIETYHDRERDLFKFFYYGYYFEVSLPSDAESGYGPLICRPTDRFLLRALEVGNFDTKENVYAVAKTNDDKWGEMCGILSKLGDRELRELEIEVARLFKRDARGLDRFFIPDPKLCEAGRYRDLKTTHELKEIVGQLQGALRQICQIWIDYECHLDSVHMDINLTISGVFGSRICAREAEEQAQRYRNTTSHI